MEYEKHKIILPKFDNYEEVLEYVSDDTAIYLYQGGDWDKINTYGNGRPTLKEPLTLEQFLCSVRHHFPNGFRVGDKYIDKWGHKIDN